jgi:hypothetical protein
MASAAAANDQYKYDQAAPVSAKEPASRETFAVASAATAADNKDDDDPAPAVIAEESKPSSVHVVPPFINWFVWIHNM